LIRFALLVFVASACGGAAPPACTDDADGDGWCVPEDCSDINPEVHPGQPEVWYDGLDTACDGDGEDYDADGDGWQTNAAGTGLDCDDVDPLVTRGRRPRAGTASTTTVSRGPTARRSVRSRSGR
jgi:hypothetical protein